MIFQVPMSLLPKGSNAMNKFDVNAVLSIAQ